MGPFATSEFFQAFNSILNTPNDSVNYCMVCLRNGEERRLVRPRAFKDFILAMKMDYSYWHNNLICYLCERQASNAYRFYKTAQFSAKLKHIVRAVVTRGSFNLFLKKIEEEKVGTLMKVDGELKKIRSHSLLLPTEVLIVDSCGVEMGQPATSSASTQAEVFIIPDDVSEVNSRAQSTEASMAAQDTVVILDEDDDVPLSTLTKQSTQPRNIITPKNIQELIDKPSHRNQLLHMALSQPQKPVTTMKLSEDNSKTSLVSYEQLLENAPPAGFILHPIVLSTDGSFTVPTLSAQILNEKLVYGTNQVPNLNTTVVPSANLPNALMNVRQGVRISNDGANFKSAVVPNSIKDSSPVEDKIKVEQTEKDPLDINDSANGNRAKRKRMEEIRNSSHETVKAPVENNVRIDWEDKIPMDVISFMDATDPNAQAIVPHPPTPPPPPSMEISNVRSLNEMVRRAIKRPPDNPVIDLC